MLAALVTALTQVDDLVARRAFRLMVDTAGTGAEGRACVSTAAAVFAAGTVRHRLFAIEVAGVQLEHESPLSPEYLNACPARSRMDPMATLTDRITVDPAQCGGRPCVRGLRIRVTDVLDLLACGLTPAQVLDELPDLETDDITACLRFASRRLNHPIVAA